MEFDIKQLATAMRLIAEEKNLPEDVVKEIIEHALAAAYKKDYGDREQEVKVDMNIDTGDVTVHVEKEVVDTVEDENFEISLADAKKAKKDAKIGDLIEQFSKVDTFGRVAAQTAKQVIMQRLREAEREVVMAEYEDKVEKIVNAVVVRVEQRLVRLEVGKAQAIMPVSEQSRSERYFPGQRLKVYLKEIEKGFRGPQLIVSRGSSELVRQLFEAEVPEMESGAVEIKAIAREAGIRTKLAVASSVQGVDPVGTFVGGHGTRVNAIVNEIGDQEKIDIVVWDENPEVFIASALSPTKVTKVTIDTKDNRAKVLVPEDQLSVAIGKGGQNVRLASKLTGIELDIESSGSSEAKEEPQTKVNDVQAPKEEVKTEQKPKKLKRKSEIEKGFLDAIESQDVA